MIISKQISILLISFVISCATMNNNPGEGTPALPSAPTVMNTVPTSLPGSIPELSKVDKKFCENKDNLSSISLVIKGTLGDKSWEEVQSEYIKSATTESNAKSLLLQQARATLAICAKELYGAVPTGSARDLTEINTKNALKDIDMSVPFDNVETSNQWLKNLVPEPDKMLLFSLLSEPISSLPCRALKGKSLTSCSLHNTTETSQILVLNEILNNKSHSKDAHYASPKDITRICPTGFILPPEYSEVYSILSLNPETQNEFVSKFPELPKKTSSYKSSVRYKVIFIALKNPAYYLQPDSIRKWVVEREKVFTDELNSKYPNYVASKNAREIEKEGAVLEQWIFAHRYADSFYYRFKYLFRALEHISFDIEKENGELFAIHKLLKKTRPSSIKDAYTDFIKLNDSEAQKEVPKLAELKSITQEKFEEIVKTSEAKQITAILEYYKSRRKEKNTTWNQICRE
ncbi:MAG: hypothetical protein SFU98_15295 [Leptospiraceae bacterium]|nr:hypothetical protein [Leptospiraceae bacterium]